MLKSVHIDHGHSFSTYRQLYIFSASLDLLYILPTSREALCFRDALEEIDIYPYSENKHVSEWAENVLLVISTKKTI